MKETWKIFLSDAKRKTEFYITLPFLGIILLSLTLFLGYVENREGFSFNDPLLAIFPPIDLTWMIFTLIYAGLIISIINLIKNPSLLLFALQAYGIMITLRIIAMYLVPFHPPVDIILLKDPFVEYFGTGKTLTKDLFFSGHTATLFLLYLVVKNKILRYILLTATVLVGISVLLQHVHYSIDVFAAPLFAYIAYRGTFYIKNQLNIQKV